MREYGKIKQYNKERGFGFIICDNYKEDIFFHVTQLEKPGDVDLLTPDTKVGFETRKKKSGYNAINVSLLSFDESSH